MLKQKKKTHVGWPSNMGATPGRLAKAQPTRLVRGPPGDGGGHPGAN